MLSVPVSGSDLPQVRPGEYVHTLFDLGLLAVN